MTQSPKDRTSPKKVLDPGVAETIASDEASTNHLRPRKNANDNASDFDNVDSVDSVDDDKRTEGALPDTTPPQTIPPFPTTDPSLTGPVVAHPSIVHDDGGDDTTADGDESSNSQSPVTGPVVINPKHASESGRTAAPSTPQTAALTTPPNGQLRPTLAEGARLDRYRLEHVVGQGAFSTVYRAFDTALSLPVVIKVLHADASEAAVTRFRNEIFFSRRVHHPGFCRIFELHEEAGPDGPLRYLTMEHVEGRTLGDVMNEGPMSSTRALSIARALCDVVAAAHDQGVVHGDLKPGNVMVRREIPRSSDRRSEPRDELVVLDFGAASAKDVRDTGVRVGSVRYMAPELFEGERPSPQSDLWAIGVIAYGCLTGHYPFNGTTERVVAEATRQPPPLPSSEEPDLSAVVDEVVGRALQRDRKERYADCRVFALALEEALITLRPRTSFFDRLKSLLAR